jgi:hypothetical protein
VYSIRYNNIILLINKKYYLRTIIEIVHSNIHNLQMSTNNSVCNTINTSNNPQSHDEYIHNMLYNIYKPDVINNETLGVLRVYKSGALCIMISELAALAGMNCWKNDTAVEDHVEKYEHSYCHIAKRMAIEDDEIHKPNCEAFYTLIPGSKCEQITYRDEYQRLCTVYPDVLKLLQQGVFRNIDVTSISESTQSISEYVNVTQTKIVDQMKANPELTMSNVINSTVTSDLQHHISTSSIQGIRHETLVIDILRQYSYDIRDFQSKVYGTITINGTTIRLYGKVDGILYNSMTGLPVAVVDIKYRQSQVDTTGKICVKTTGKYDDIQLCVYGILRGLKAIMIEHYNGCVNLQKLNGRCVLYTNNVDTTILGRIYDVGECVTVWYEVINSNVLRTNIKTILNMTANPYSSEAIMFAKQKLLAIKIVKVQSHINV